MSCATRRFRLVSVALGWVLVVLATAAPARAGISYVSMFRSDKFSQTGDGNTLSDDGSYLALQLNSTGPGDYDSVAATYPGPGSPVALPPITSDMFQFVSGLFPNQAAMDTDFPTGTYAFDATNSSGTDTASFDYLSDAYPLSRPYLDGTNYTDLQGMNSSVPFLFQFSPYNPNPAVDESFIFLRITDINTDTEVFNAGFLPPTTTSLLLAGGILLPGTAYSYELIYSDRDFVPSTGTDFDAVISYDLRTSGTFTTAAVPEPSSLLMAAFGSLALLGCSRLRR